MAEEQTNLVEETTQETPQETQTETPVESTEEKKFYFSGCTAAKYTCHAT